MHDPSKLAVEAAPSLEEGRLRIPFVVRNTTEVAILASLRVVDGAQNPLAAGAYVCFWEESATLHFLLGPPPPGHGGMALFIPPQPHSRHLEPGGQFEGELVFEIPVQEWQPLAEMNTAAIEFELDDAGPEEVMRVAAERYLRDAEARRARLSVDYVEAEGAPARELEGQKGWWVVGKPAQERVSLDMDLPSPVPVKVRTDNFPRF